MLSLSSPILHQVRVRREELPLFSAVVQPLVIDYVTASCQTAQKLDCTTNLGMEIVAVWRMEEWKYIEALDREKMVYSRMGEGDIKL